MSATESATPAPASAKSRIPIRPPWLTLLLIVINVAVYLWQGVKFGHFAHFSEEELMLLGANVAPLSATGDYWQLLSNLFIHASPQHLCANMLALAFIGSTLETLIARWQWLLLYLAGGVCASFLSASQHFDMMAFSFLGGMRTLFLSVGASGAIMSLAGTVVALALFHLVRQEDDGQSWRVLKSALLFSMINLVYGFFDRSIDNAAHIGGLLFGLLAGMPIIASRLSGGVVRKIVLTAGPLALIVLAWSYQARSISTNPDAADIRLMAWQKLEDIRTAYMVKSLYEAERRGTPAPVTRQEALGTVIPLPGIGRIVPTGDPQRVYLLKNGDASQIVEYDLAGNAPLRTIVDLPYQGNDLWGCPFEQCFGVGVSDLQMDEAAGKGYASSLIKGAVSRIDLKSGKIDYSTATGPFPSRLLLRDKRLYAFDRVNNSLAILDADSGKLLQKLEIPNAGEGSYDWPQGEDMAFSADGKSLYLLTAAGQAVRLELGTGKFTPLGTEHTLAMGKDSQDRVWLQRARSVAFPDSDEPTHNTPYDVADQQGERGLRGFMDPDGKHPLVLLPGNGAILGESHNTGQALRAFPFASSSADIFSVASLDGRRFYLTGRKSTQVMDIDKSAKVSDFVDPATDDG